MLSTPQPVDQYSRFMAELFDERDVVGVSVGFQAFFGAPESGSKSIFSNSASAVDIDIIRGNEKIGALIQRGTSVTRNLKSKDVSDQKGSSFSRAFPLGEEEDIIEADQLIQRVLGEAPYSRLEKIDRLRILSSNNHKEHLRRLVRMFEVLAAQSVLTGKMDSILGTSNVGLQYDFRRNTDNIFSVGTAWDQALAVPMDDIDTACDLVRKNGRIKPDMAVIGGSAMDALLKNDDFKERADNRRFDLIQVGLDNPVPPKFQRFIDAGFNARGRLRTAKGYELWLFTYIDGYDNAAGDFVNFMPLDEMLVASSSARADRYFGPSDHMPSEAQRLDVVGNMFGFQNPMTMAMPNIKGSGVVLPEMFHYDAYPTHNNKGVVTRTQTAPIFATTMTDAFVTIQGLIT